MALSDKNIVITPNISAASDPKIVFSGADANTAAQNITLTAYPTSNGTLSFDGSAGQLFSITNSLSGSIFSVNDVSGIPSIEVLDTGTIKLAQYGGNVGVGLVPSGTYKLEVLGGISGNTITSTVATGTAPLVVTSNTVVTNLNADLLDGLSSSDLKAYTDSVVSSNNSSLRANDGITLASAKAYADSNDGITLASAKSYTDLVNASNNVTLKAYTDSTVASNNVTLKAYTDSVVSSNNSSLRANDGITLASAKSYADSNDGITLASAKSYTDAKNTFSTLVNISNDLIVTGNLTIQGTTTTLNSTTLRINDKNLELANVSTPTNITADGGGITVIGATNKTFNWVNSTGAWTSSENLDLASGKSFSINGTTVLTGSALSSNVTGSSLTSVGTITSGVWNAGNVTASQLTSTVATGTAPLVVTSNTVVTNLNADLLDGLSSSDLKAYTDSVVASNNSSITTAYKSYTDSTVASNNVTLKAYTDSTVASNNITLKAYTDSANTFLRANDGITLASARSYTDSANTFLQANDGITLASAKSYTDAKNTFTTLSASGQITSTAATTTSSGGGSVYLNGSNNRIDFNTSGSAAPAFTTRSIGTKIVLYPQVGASTVDYALGMEDYNLWSSVPSNLSNFKWYVGTSQVATLSGTGTFSANTLTSTVATGTAPFTVTSTTNVANLNASSLSGATFASPGPIGSGTASTGAFTTLSASSTVSGTGFSTYLASPPAIGATTANTGAFTNLSYTGTLTGGTGVIAIGTNQIYKDANGNVGIGTSSLISGNLSGSLTAAGVLSASGYLNTHQTNKAVIQLYNNIMGFRSYGATSGTGQITFSVGGGGGNTDAEAMRIDPLGNVGIGTSSPTPTANYGNLSLGGVSGGQLIFQNGGALNGTIYGNATLLNIGTTGYLIFSSGGTSSERMRIDSSGNVGIGNTPSGTYKLEVTGNIYSTGATFNTNATGFVKHAATVAPTVDMLQIDNTGFPVVTAGVSAAQITYVGGSAAIESSANRIDITPGTLTGGTWNAFRVAPTLAAATGVTLNAFKANNITAGAGTDNIIYAGTGWDSIINYNGTTVINGTGNLIAGQLTGQVS